MNLDKNLIPEFKQFMETQYGVAWVDTKEGSPMKEEITRCMYKERLLLLRSHFPRRSADCVEVFYSEKPALEKLERDFYITLDERRRIESDDLVDETSTKN